MAPIPTHSPIRHLREDIERVAHYVVERGLQELAGPVWLVTEPTERREMLEHMIEQVRDDESPYRRFHYIRDELDAYDSEEDFLEILSSSRELSDIVPSMLQVFIALYVDTSRGSELAHFSSAAFFRHYIEAHSTANDL